MDQLAYKAAEAVVIGACFVLGAFCAQKTIEVYETSQRWKCLKEAYNIR